MKQCKVTFFSEFWVCCHPKILLPWQRDVTTYRFVIQIFKHIIYTIGEIKTWNTRFHALIQFDLQSFDQNILCFSRVKPLLSGPPNKRTPSFKRTLSRVMVVLDYVLEIRTVIWRQESARKGLNSTSGAQFASQPLVKPVVWFARAVFNWPSRSVANVFLLRSVSRGSTIGLAGWGIWLFCGGWYSGCELKTGVGCGNFKGPAGIPIFMGTRCENRKGKVAG